LLTLGTLRHTSTNVSDDGKLVAGSMTLDIRWERECDPHETVLPKIVEVGGVLAVGPEVVGVKRSYSKPVTNCRTTK